MYEAILKRFRAQTTATLFENVDAETGLAKTPMIFDMLPYLDQGPVALAMIRTLFPTYPHGIADKILEYYRVLQKGHFMEMLLATFTLLQGRSLTDARSRTTAAAFAFSKMTETLTENGFLSFRATGKHGGFHSVAPRRNGSVKGRQDLVHLFG